MNKGAIKTFAIWARNKLMSDVAKNAYLIGITKDGIQKPLPQSTLDMQYFDIGSGTPYALPKAGITMRNKLVSALEAEAKQSDYATAYRNLLEHTASTWFNRLCAIRFMEVNDYFNDGLRVLSSLEEGKKDSDLMTSPFDSDLEFTESEQQQIVNWKLNNESEKLFGFLLHKKCEEIAEYLPGLFATKEEPSTLLVNFSIADAEGVVQHLVNDIEEEDWKEQVQIIGWLYQFYNSEFKDEVNALLKKKGQSLNRNRIPAVTQLFTPEWIVKYMVENSLGRIWTDGHPNEEIKAEWKYYLEEAKQEPEVQEHLAEIRKEYSELAPEDLTFIDPCMGSGHILCYAFDVLMQIYESQGYTSRDAVRSILENNLFGLDIDKRAYQLAYFSIMMKAREYDRGAFRRGYTPKIYAFEESNGITEEQMEIFGADLNDMERNIAANQMKKLIATFKNAEEYGSILNVDTMDWNLLRRFVASADAYGFLDRMVMDLSSFIEKINVIIDIGEILSQKYWVTCTNPPYMNPTPVQRSIVDKYYSDAKVDLGTVFILRLNELTRINGFQSMITMHSWMFISSYQAFRKKVRNIDTVCMAHLGTRAFDEIGGEVVQTTTFINRKSHTIKYIGVYDRLIDALSQDGKRTTFLSGNRRFYSPKERFDIINGMPIAYWVSQAGTEAFGEKTLDEIVKASVGIQTGDNNLFLRLWWEVNYSNIRFSAESVEDSFNDEKWFPYNKGGEFRKWYGNDYSIIDWKNDGENIKRNSAITGHHYQQYADQFKFKTLVTWSRISTGKPAFRIKNNGYLSDMAGFSLYANEETLKQVLAYCNTKVVSYYLEFLAPTLNIMVGSVLSLPYKQLNDSKEKANNLIDKLILSSKEDWDAFECSWDFVRHPLISVVANNRMLFTDVSNVDLAECYVQWDKECSNRFRDLKANEEEINNLFIKLYGLQEELTPNVDDEDVTVQKADLQRDIKSLISYAVGCMLGRYSLDIDGLAFAAGDWNEAFASKYKTFIPDDDNCIPITDEDYFSDDIVGRFIEFIKVVYGEKSLETNLQFIADAIGGKDGDSREVIRKYFLNDFFKDHCKTYSVTGSGKRPIYWLFDSGKQNGFKALVYMHRWDSNTIATVRARYVTKVQEKYENELRAMDLQMEHMSDLRQKASLQKRKEKVLKQVDEIKVYDELIGHLALEHIDIDLDDGVKVNYEKVQQDRNGERFAILAPIK